MTRKSTGHRSPPPPCSHLRCIACEAEHDAREVRYHCDCGGLLEVRHDLGRIRAEHGDLRETFERRLAVRRGPGASGVWRYREIVLPDLPPVSLDTVRALTRTAGVVESVGEAALMDAKARADQAPRGGHHRA